MDPQSGTIDCILVDDEQPCLDLMELFMQRRQLPLRVLGKFSRSREALAAIDALRPELVFMDIVMPDLSGIELVRSTAFQDYAVVFTTAHPQFGLDAARLSSFDYLLKPIVEEDLARVVTRFAERKKRQELLTARRMMDLLREERPVKPRRISFPIAGGTTYEDEQSIEYFESDGNLTRIHFTDQGWKYVNCHLKGVEESVTSPNFIRTHKRFMVNMDHIRSLSRKEGGFIEMRNGTQIPLSRGNRDQVIAAIDAYMGRA